MPSWSSWKLRPLFSLCWNPLAPSAKVFFIRRISSRVRDGEFAGALPSAVERLLINSLAIALQGGNAFILREGIAQLDRPLTGGLQQQRHFSFLEPRELL